MRFERFQRRVQPILNHIFYWPVQFFLRRKFDIEFVGKANIPADGPCLVAAKQNTNYDPVVASMGMWETGVATRYVMRDLYLPPVVRELSVFLLSWMGVRRILRKREVLRGKDKEARRQILAEAKERIRGDSSYLALEAEHAGHLFFFPEGTRAQGEMRPFHKEFFDSALELDRGIRILPVGIEYSGGKKVHVRYGEPFPCTGDVDAIVQRCYEDVRRLSNL